MSKKCKAYSVSKLGLDPADNRKAFYAGWDAALAEQPAIKQDLTPEQHQCNFPLCQSEEYQQSLAEQIKRELYTGEPAQQRHISYVCPQCHWSLEKQPAQKEPVANGKPEGGWKNAKTPHNFGKPMGYALVTNADTGIPFMLDGGAYTFRSDAEKVLARPEYAQTHHIVELVAKDTSPPAQRKPLTDEQIAEVMMQTWGCASIAPRHAPAFARAIEAAHGIKENT